MGLRIKRRNKNKTNSAPALVPTDPVTMMDLKKDQCRWPVEENGRGYLFCGAESHPDHQYCPHHKHRAIQHRKLPKLNVPEAA